MSTMRDPRGRPPTARSSSLDATAVLLDALEVQARTTTHLVNLARLSKRQEQRITAALNYQRTTNDLLGHAEATA